MLHNIIHVKCWCWHMLLFPNRFCFFTHFSNSVVIYINDDFWHFYFWYRYFLH